ncbi:MAG: nucleotidyltransferase domain-containing protein [Candidatus Methylomirabilia bacterium]
MQRAEALKRLIARGQEDPGVLAVVLFGSVARGQTTPTSDLDVCLVLDPNLREGMSHKRLEYLAEFDLDIHVFQQLPLYVRRRVLKEGQVMLSKDDDVLYELAFRTARAFEDFKHIYRNYLEAVLDARP